MAAIEELRRGDRERALEAGARAAARSSRSARARTGPATIGVSTRVLFLLATEQRVVRGRPKGSWTSSQYRWAPMDAWLAGRRAVDARGRSPRRARAPVAGARSARRRPPTSSGGPAGPSAQTKAALAAVGAVEVELEDGAGLGAARRPRAGPLAQAVGRAAARPRPDDDGLEGADVVPRRPRPALFDRNGNAGPTVWVDGRVVGGWAQRRDGEVVTELLEDIGRTATTAVDRAAAALQAWLGDIRVTPRFPTPLQKQLAADARAHAGARAIRVAALLGDEPGSARMALGFEGGDHRVVVVVDPDVLDRVPVLVARRRPRTKPAGRSRTGCSSCRGSRPASVPTVRSTGQCV